MPEGSITDWALTQIKDSDAGPYVVGIVAFGASVGWIYTFVKGRIEAKKLKEELRKVRAENITKLNEARTIQKAKCQTLNMAMANLRNALLPENAATCTSSKMHTCRDEIFSTHEEYMEALNSYLEMIAHLASKTEMRIRASVEVIPDLNFMCTFLAMVNHDELIKRIPGAKPYKLDVARRNGFLIRVKALVPRWYILKRWKIRKFRKLTDPHLRK